jgi:hypothetical protein
MVFHVGPCAQVLNVDEINIPEGIDVIVKLVLRLSHLRPIRPKSPGDVLNEDSAEPGTVLVYGITCLATIIPVSISSQKNIAPIIPHRQPG